IDRVVPDAEARFEPRRPLDLSLTFHLLGAGTWRRGDGGDFWHATRTPAGAATVQMSRRHGLVDVRGWGPGAGWAVAHAPVLCGEEDDDSGFAPAHPLIARLHRQRPGMRTPRTHAVFEALVPSVLAQLVAGIEARSSYRRLRARGHRAFDRRANARAARALPRPPGSRDQAADGRRYRRAKVRAAPPTEKHREQVTPRQASTVASSSSASSISSRMPSLSKISRAPAA